MLRCLSRNVQMVLKKCAPLAVSYRDGYVQYCFYSNILFEAKQRTKYKNKYAVLYIHTQATHTHPDPYIYIYIHVRQKIRRKKNKSIQNIAIQALSKLDGYEASFPYFKLSLCLDEIPGLSFRGKLSC